MSPRRLCHRGILVLALPLATIPLVPSPAASQCRDANFQIMVNRRSVRTEGVSNLMHLLTRAVSASQLRGRSDRPSDQPLVLIDGIETAAGLRLLDDIPLEEVQSVTTVRPVDAVPRYGAKAEGGAILVETRLSRVSRGQAHPPDCPLKRDP